MHCPRCGSQFPDEAQYCPSCGAWATPEAQTPQQHPQQSETRPQRKKAVTQGPDKQPRTSVAAAEHRVGDDVHPVPAAVSGSVGLPSPPRPWWKRQSKGSKVALVFVGMVVLAALAGTLTPVVINALRPSDAELVHTLTATTNAAERHKAAIDLAARHSLQATAELVAAAAGNSTAGDGLSALRDEYISSFGVVMDIEALRENETALRETAECLGVIGDSTSVVALGSLCCSSDFPLVSVRVSAAQALAKTETDDTIPRLIQAVMLAPSGDPTREISKAAAAGLTLMPEAPEALIKARAENAGNTSACSAIENALVLIGEPAVAPLVAQLSSVDWADEVLAEIGNSVVSEVSQKLDSEEPIVRYRALGVFLRQYMRGNAPSDLVAPWLVPLLIEARSQAHYGDERDIAAEAVLVAIGEPAIEPLVALLSETDWADDVLAKIGSAVIPAVVPELQSEKAIVRYRALGVLLQLYAADKDALAAQLVQPEMIPTLIEARDKAGYGDDRDDDIAAVLTEIGEPAAKALVALLPGSAWVGDVLAGMGDVAAPALLEALQSKDSATRFAAADVLVEMQRSNPESVVSLMSALEKDNLEFIATNYAFYIRLGQSGTEDTLTQALHAHGDKQMAVDYLNCGNERLETAAKQWAADNGYEVYTTEGSHYGPQWGEGE